MLRVVYISVARGGGGIFPLCRLAGIKCNILLLNVEKKMQLIFGLFFRKEENNPNAPPCGHKLLWQFQNKQSRHFQTP